MYKYFTFIKVLIRVLKKKKEKTVKDGGKKFVSSRRDVNVKKI